MSKLQKAKKPKAKPTQKQKQMQNVVVNIHKPTRAKKSKLQKEASPKEKRIPHPPPQFSFSPVISMPSVQSDSSITRHIVGRAPRQRALWQARRRAGSTPQPGSSGANDRWGGGLESAQSAVTG